jgi:hypothetical protein
MRFVASFNGKEGTEAKEKAFTAACIILCCVVDALISKISKIGKLNE